MAASSRDPKSFRSGVLCGMLIPLGADGLHWFITPASQSATSLRMAGVGLQVLVAFAAAYLLYRRFTRLPSLEARSRA